MKKILLLAMIAVNALSVSAAKNYATLKGTVANKLADSVTLQYFTYDNNWLNFDTKTITAVLDKDGKFNATFPLSHDYTEVNFQNGEQATEVFMSPGDNLEITLDGTDFDASIEYKGFGGTKPDVANFSAKHMLASGFSRNFSMEMQQMMRKAPRDFVSELEQKVKKEQDFLIDNSKGLPQSFIEFWGARYVYHQYLAMLQYPMMHEMIKAKSYDIGDIPAESFAVAKQVPEKFDDKLMYVDAYRNYIREFYHYKLRAEGLKNDLSHPEFMTEKKLELSRKNMPLQSEQFVYAATIDMNLKGTPIAQTEAQYSKFTSIYGDTDYSKYLEKKIANRRRLSKGSPATDFTVVSPDGKDVKLSALKGKVVYIDFWASWCGPCKAQFPHTKKIKEHFEGKDVVFVYVSIDEDAAAWEKAMGQYELAGMHTRVEGWKAKLAQDYGVNGIPAYFLVDKEGNFAVDVTPRPSQGDELIKIIEDIL